ncbi:MAG: DUF485 domain-containing protein [Elusimicrobiales bacterium]|nr:DUF485 domain-containing protein [Elusimicrobiales bacterium]
MLHEPASQSGTDNAAPYKARLGVHLFIVYATVYAIFVIINVAKPLMMENIIIFGLNLAVVYGFFLIIFALVLALIYNSMCNAKEKALNKKEDK